MSVSPSWVIVVWELREAKVKSKIVPLEDWVMGLTKRLLAGITWPQESVEMRDGSRYGNSWCR